MEFSHETGRPQAKFPHTPIEQESSYVRKRKHT